MLKIAPLLFVLLASNGITQEPSILAQVSPKLRQFIADHPAASKALTNALHEVAARHLAVFYFYTADETRPPALHHSPDESSLVVTLRENAQPCDEFICLLYEIVNAKSDETYRALFKEAKTGTISKERFIDSVFEKEFVAAKEMKLLITNLGLTPAEADGSRNLQVFRQCPDTFAEFLTQVKADTNSNFQLKSYEEQYDAVRNHSSVLPAKKKSS